MDARESLNGQKSGVRISNHSSLLRELAHLNEAILQLTTVPPLRTFETPSHIVTSAGTVLAFSGEDASRITLLMMLQIGSIRWRITGGK
jgi:hypothetical protein